MQELSRISYAPGSVPSLHLAKKKKKKKPRSDAPSDDQIEYEQPAPDSDQKKSLRNYIRLPRLKWEYLAAGLLLVAMAAQMFLHARFKSATMDEQNHIVRGLTYLRTGDLRMLYLHPPLINLISALPLARDPSVKLPLEGESWQGSKLGAFGDEFLWKSNNDSQSIIFRARLPIIFLALILGMTVYLWGREIYSERAALLALTLLAFDPNILAHGSIATNDLGVTCFVAVSAYTFWRFLERQTWGRVLMAGIGLGLAQASKYSALLLLPALGLITLAHLFWRSDEENRIRNIKRFIGMLALLILVALITIWSVYGFRMETQSGESAAGVRYIEQIESASRRVSAGNSTFLFGSYSVEGWWYYFPLAFLVKTPLPTLLFLCSATVYCHLRRAWKRSLILIVPAIVYFGASMIISLNIGYRHLLPILPFLFVFAGQLASINLKRFSKPALAGAALVIWLVVNTLWVAPHYLAFFNETVGGASNGYKALSDSNLDWGQDLIGLKRYMEREGIETVKLSYFGVCYPESYGINYEPLPGYPKHQWPYKYAPPILAQPRPEPGVYAISATNIQGLFFGNRDLYAWFRNRKPDATIGYSIFIYDLRR